MGLLTAGYWSTTFWTKDYWQDDYWQDSGAVPFPLYLTLGILQAYGIQISEVKEHSIKITDSQDYTIIIEG